MNALIFKKILTRNLVLPILLCAMLAGVFSAVILMLLASEQRTADADHHLTELHETYRVIIDSETGLRGFFLGRGEELLEPRRLAEVRLPESFPRLIEQARNLGLSDDPVREAERLYRRWNDSAEESVRLMRLNRYQPGIDVMTRKAAMDEVRKSLERAIDQAELAREAKVSYAQSLARVVLISVILLTLLAGGALAIFGRRQLLALARTYDDALSQSQRQNRLLNEQAWVRTGQLQAAESVRGVMTGRELAQRLLDNVARYLDAPIGAVYLRNDSGEFELAASHAYPIDAAPSSRRSFAPGQSFVGQVAREQKLRVMQDLPADYVQVGSGLGATPPRQLAVAPFLVDGETQAVIELGFLDLVSETKQRLLEEISEPAGAAIRAAAYRETLQRLLEESQALSEELQTQQEELRVANEELEERSRVLQEAQARLEGQHAELEQSNEQLEEQARLLEEQKVSVDRQNRALGQAQRELQAKAEELESASRYKSEFMANMSHELRTPLNSSLILAKILRDNASGNLTSEQVEFANTIYSAGNDLLLLINDILDLSKVEAGKLDILPETVSLQEIMKSLDRVFRPLAEAKGLELRMVLDRAAPPHFKSDRQRVEQILRNLLANALKFTSNGYVELRAEADPRGDGLLFSVKDTGIGIAKHQQEVIFEAFRQADGTTSRKHGGTGLGLSISRSLAHILGGRVTVESEAGMGSVFRLRLPRNYDPANAVESSLAPTLATAPTPPPAPEPPTKSPDSAVRRLPDDRDLPAAQLRKVLLIVEDEYPYAKVLYELAHEFGFSCLLAFSLEEGYSLAIQYSPLAIVLDMKLPDGLGLTLLNRLKNNLATRHIPVHGLSITDMSREALHLGAASFQMKSSDLEELRHSFRNLVEKLKERTKHVLILEDDPGQREMIEELVSAPGVEIDSVGRGDEALARLHERVYDCLIMDVTLPGMSGFEFLERLTAHTGVATPPVIVYTGRQITREEEEILARYSRSVIIKGARSPERLLDEVTLFLHQSEAQLSAEKRELLLSSRNRELSFDGRKILIVDDDVRNIFALTAVLEPKGAKVLIARTGREALARLESDPDTDLVLMDVMMPQMDGLQATREIRKHKRFRDLPIIAVTAKAMRDDYEKCLDAGANDYMAKPIDVDKLVSLMRVWLPKRWRS